MINHLLGEPYWEELEDHLTEMFQLLQMDSFYGFKNQTPERNAELVFLMLIKFKENKAINPEERYDNFNYRKLDVGERIYAKEEILEVLENNLPHIKRIILNKLFGYDVFFETMLIVPKYSEERFNHFIGQYGKIENLNELFLKVGVK